MLSHVAAWYFDNPPTTWRIARRPSGWWIVAVDGTYISWHPTKRDAAANLTDGPEAHAHYDTLDWLLGYSPDPRSRPLADANARQSPGSCPHEHRAIEPVSASTHQFKELSCVPKNSE
jgi:hypothetical protein